MKKAVKSIILTSAAIIGMVYLRRYSYILKAIKINLNGGPLTPSNDDEENFPSKKISNSNPLIWKKHSQYNSKQISETLAEELKKTRASSLVVIKERQIIHEQYWKKHTQLSLINSFSMTKGFLSLLTGFAIQDGFIDSENQLISTVFPQYKNCQYGKNLTFKHLMTMQAGFDWNEEYRHPFAENSKQYFIDDLEKQVFETKLKNMPGEKYEYQSISAQLLGMALTQVTGKSLSQYMSEKIWKPLGMELSGKWSMDEKGNEKGFCCVHGTTRDFAKIGQFILQKGMWEGKQLLNKEYFEKMLTPTEENDAFCYTIWAGDDSQIEYRFFYGFLGQFIIIIPDQNMVIVKTGFYNKLEVDEKKRPLQVKILIDELLRIY